MKSPLLSLSLSLLILNAPMAGRAEPPEFLKGATETFERALAAHGETFAAQVRGERDAYLAVLKAARRQEEGAGRAAGVAALDAETKAVLAGPLPEKAPAGFPSQVDLYRKRYLAASAQAARIHDASRQTTLKSHLGWIDDVMAQVRRLNDPALIKAIEGERARVAALGAAPAPAAAGADATSEGKAPPGAGSAPVTPGAGAPK